MADTSKSETPGGSHLSHQDAVNVLLQAEAPEEDNKANQESEAETTTEEVEATETETEESEDGVKAQSEDESEEVEEEEVSEETEDDTEEEYTYRVVVDGEEKYVTQDELTKNYQLEQTARKRLSDAAEMRKVTEAEKTALTQQREQYAHALQALEGNLQQIGNAAQPNWDALYEEDPLEYVRQKEVYRENQERLQQVQTENARVANEQLQHHLVQESAKLAERIPEWKDTDLAAKEKSAVIKYAQRVGFSEEEINTTYDSRAVTTLRKAMLYDQLMDTKPDVKKKTQAAPKLTRSSTPKEGRKNSQQKQTQKAFDRLNKSGSMDDAVDYLLQRSS